MPDETDSEQPGRRHRRVSVPLLVQYRFDAREDLYTDYALNVSQSGLFIAMNTDRPVGTRVYVQLITRDGAHFLQGEGRVVRSAQGVCAIELSGFDEDARAILDGLVRVAMADQEPLSSRPSGRGRA